MLALVNGMDVVKSTDLMGGKEYKGHTKNKGISLESPQPLWMLAPVNGMDAVNYCSIADFHSLKRLPTSV